MRPLNVVASAPPARLAHDVERRGGTSLRIIEPSRGPDEIGVLGLEPIAARLALVEAALPFRHDALKAKFAGLSENDRTLGDERFAEQNSIHAWL
jgi:hypothetical protein